MKNLTTIFLLFSSLLLYGQSMQYSRIKIDLSERSIGELAQLELAIDHGFYKKGRYLIHEFSNSEIEKIESAGFEYEVLIEDLDHFYKYENQSAVSEITERDDHCDESTLFNYDTPENFQLGSFMGFLTYEEMLDNLDSMLAKYPDLISPRMPIDTFLTFEGRPIYWLKISDNPLLEEDEPEALYTSLHHAREPTSLSSLIFYMWYLLENYDSDPSIQYLLNNTELYFVPCVNPDGYIYNVSNYQNGGSIMWRKNRRDNNDGNYGIDLNRNYAYQWGLDDSGSSPNTSSDVYRGTEPFSEPETRAIQYLCNNHEFQIGYNNHSSGNLLLIPWNYVNGVSIPDPAFVVMAEKLVEENHFWAGTLHQTLNYRANGNADDWMFGESVSKPPVFAFTPEIGPIFYPPEPDITYWCKSVLLQNLKSSFFLLNYGEATDRTETILSEIDGQFKFELTRYGLMDGTLTVSLTAISDNIVNLSDPQNFNLDPFTTIEGFFDYTLTNDINLGEEIVFLLTVDNGGFLLNDTLTKIFHETEIVFSDNGDNLDQWDDIINSTHLWEATSEDFYSESSSITDSPNSVYFSWQENYLEMDEPISLLDSTRSFLTFWAKWDIENDFDFAQVSISTNGFSYVPLCGKYTNLGTLDQENGEPLYDGEQLSWVKEEIDLTDYMGQDIYLRFSMISDGVNNRDGFYFDDLSIVSLGGDIVDVDPIDVSNFNIKTKPNPASDYVNFDFSQKISEGEVFIYNPLGQLMHFEKIQNQKTISISTSSWNPGFYFYQINAFHKQLITSRIVIVH